MLFGCALRFRFAFCELFSFAPCLLFRFTLCLLCRFSQLGFLRIAIYISAFLADLNLHRFTFTAGARDIQGAARFALQSEFTRRAAVFTVQVRQ